MSEQLNNYGLCMANVAKGGVDGLMKNHTEFIEIGTTLQCNHCDECTARVDMADLQPVAVGICRHSRQAIVLGRVAHQKLQ